MRLLAAIRRFGKALAAGLPARKGKGQRRTDPAPFLPATDVNHTHAAREAHSALNLARLVEALAGSDEFRVRWHPGVARSLGHIDGVGEVPRALVASWERRGWVSRDRSSAGALYWIREEGFAVLMTENE
ncbi:MAG: hypothetical protein VW405_00275 [Rhodospirillaceae bacterium]